LTGKEPSDLVVTPLNDTCFCPTPVENRSLDSLGFELSESQPSLLASQVSDFIHLQLGIDSTLQQLSLDDFVLESSELGRKVSLAFEANPLLPGVILTEAGQFIGMISRRRFFEYMSRPFGLEVFSKRPLKDLYRFAKTDTLLLPGNTSILMAAKQSLQRSPELLYEPIVVQIDTQDYRLLDAHQLLVAQSRIHEQAVGTFQQLYQQLEKANQDLQQLATVDSLTQAANRRRFDEYLERKWRHLARQHAPLSLILCDIDFFKLYNDTYGHPAGDACLQQVADALKAAIKRPEDLVARYGGEEFAIILPYTSTKGAIEVAERIRMNVKQRQLPHDKSGVSPYVTVSLGVASLIPDLESAPEIAIAKADQALYQSKAAGRDRYTLFDNPRS
jgi:diguanylate cyclase (GGDEF)-like protein